MVEKGGCYTDLHTVIIQGKYIKILAGLLKIRHLVILNQNIYRIPLDNRRLSIKTNE